MLAVMVRVSSQVRGVNVAPQNTSTLARILNQARNSSTVVSDPGWIVTEANSAHYAMVVEVEAQRPEEARAIAIQIVKPMRSRGYKEILIYVRAAPGGTDAATRRIQWTPNGGYVEMVYGGVR